MVDGALRYVLEGAWGIHVRWGGWICCVLGFGREREAAPRLVIGCSSNEYTGSPTLGLLRR